MPTTRRNLVRILLCLCSVLMAGAACAQGFSALVSPPRIEDNAKAGATYRNVIEISNVSGQAAHYAVKTADWTLKADSTVVFSDALSTGSCRPWVGIEAPDIHVAANGKRRYRFEVAVPADAPNGECRFAIMIEGDPEPTKDAVALPVSGRIGVIIYLTVGDAVAKLDVVGRKVQAVDGRDVPVLSVRNSGGAHGRLQGFIDGKDASGRSYSFVPATLPILAGETYDIALTPQGDNDDAPAPAIVYPLQLKGHLDSGAQRIDIEATFQK